MTRRRKHEEFSLAEKSRMLDLYVRHGLSYAVVARRFGVSPEHVSRCITEARDAKAQASESVSVRGTDHADKDGLL